MPSDGRVLLPNGLIWDIPWQIRYLTPAEIIAFVVKGGTVPNSISQAFHDGLAELEHTGDWEQLPGKIHPALH